MAGPKLLLTLGVLLAAAGLSGCSDSGKEAGGGRFHTLAEENTEAQQYLPEDLPIPEGAGITFTQGDLAEGKKSSMLIYQTNESMAALGTAYQKYVREKALERGTEIVDSRNILINGKVKGAYSYSIIGSSSESQSGGNEIIVTWIEN
ncbi:hypothetical protein HQN87_10865 [Paenibacillus tritici]|uniref:Lipoprotein n=1 Tax=Paenibacillus tritici TaxID=1873425 RepID=A0ABX2DMH7_9BACL|nr:hypothetical protein [Paenibacillus tritici]NQX45834.1 hypothetical protein [Paenibacillus tritici]QUL53933.1 hypothetical protein KDC22_26890 [Paenibacillus tritici]